MLLGGGANAAELPCLLAVICARDCGRGAAALSETVGEGCIESIEGRGHSMVGGVGVDGGCSGVESMKGRWRSAVGFGV